MQSLPHPFHLLLVPVLFATLALTGCVGPSFPNVQSTPGQVSVGPIQGLDWGGHAPLVGARIFLLQAGTGGYGAKATSLLSSTYSGDGIWYLTNAGIEFWSSGTFQGTNYFGVVADNLFTAGTILYPTNNYSNIPTGNPFLPAGGFVQ